MGEGSKFRDYRGTQGQIDDADPPPPPPDERRRNARGRVGEGRSVSPRPGVRDPGKAYEGPEGEKSYGAPIDDRPEDRGKSDPPKEDSEKDD